MRQAVFGPEEFTDRSERFMAAEFIREKVFRQLGDELPYAVNVMIEKVRRSGKFASNLRSHRGRKIQPEGNPDR